MPVERHQMPVMTVQAYRARYYALQGEAAGEPQNRVGTVRVHRTFSDFFRNRVTVPEVDPSHPANPEVGTPKTFNRGSLIAYLNHEIGQGHVPPGTQRLAYGYCGGWIGGSSDQRIREIYNAVFNHHAAIEAANALRLAEERKIERADLIKLPVQKGGPLREGEHFIRHPLADEKTYFDGAVLVRLYRYGEHRVMHRVGDQQESITKGCCILDIVTRDQVIDAQALIDVIVEDTFKGVLHPIDLTARIRIRPQIFAIEGGNPSNIRHDVADALIRSFQTLREQDELAVPRKLCGMSRALVEQNGVIPENSPHFLIQYPLKESHENIGGMEGVDLHVHRVTQGAQYILPEGGAAYYDKSQDNQFLLRIVIRNNDVDVPALMRHVEAMTFRDLHKGSWEVGIITVALDPIVFPDPQVCLARRQEIIEAIRAWQPLSLEGVALRERQDKIAASRARLQQRAPQGLS